MSPVRLVCVFLITIFFMSESWSGREKFIDPLDVAAAKSAFASKKDLVGITRAGDRLVAVGQLGHIVFSDDSGIRWDQATVPVSTDLVAVYFPSATQGWAVGHDGVVLHSSDRGSSWQQQMSGRQLMDVAKKYYDSHPATNDADASQRQQFMDQFDAAAPAFTFLDIWFRNDNEGYAIGAFNLTFKTMDGGKNWTPWFDRTENPRGYHLYSIQGDASGVYVVGELGLIMRLNESSERFVSLQSPYEGSFFGVMVRGDHIIAYGLRGNAFVSANAGKSWQKLNNPSDESITGGVWLSNGDALLISQSGELLRSVSSNLSLSRLPQGNGFPSNAVVVTEGGKALAVVGPVGVEQLQLN